MVVQADATFRERGNDVSLVSIAANQNVAVAALTASRGIRVPTIELPFLIGPSKRLLFEIVWVDKEVHVGRLEVAGESFNRILYLRRE